MRTCVLPGLAGGCTAVTAWTKRFSSPVGIRSHPRLGDLVDRLEHLAGALAGRRRDVQQRRVVQELQLAPQLLVELFRELRAAALHQVPFVGGDDDAAAGLLGFAGDRRILVGRSFGGVDHEDRDVGLFDRALAPPAR